MEMICEMDAADEMQYIRVVLGLFRLRSEV